MASSSGSNVFCGAKTRAGTPCKNRAMPNGRCRLHGGKSAGAPKDNVNAVKFGIYRNRLTDEEAAHDTQINEQRGNLDAEADLVRIMIDRVLKEMEKIDSNTGLDLSESKHEVLGQGDNGSIKGPTRTTVTRRRPDFWALLDRFIGRLTNIEKMRTEFKIAEIEKLAEELKERLEQLGHVIKD